MAKKKNAAKKKAPTKKMPTTVVIDDYDFDKFLPEFDVVLDENGKEVAIPAGAEYGPKSGLPVEMLAILGYVMYLIDKFGPMSEWGKAFTAVADGVNASGLVGTDAHAAIVQELADLQAQMNGMVSQADHDAAVKIALVDMVTKADYEKAVGQVGDLQTQMAGMLTEADRDAAIAAVTADLVTRAAYDTAVGQVGDLQTQMASMLTEADRDAAVTAAIQAATTGMVSQSDVSQQIADATAGMVTQADHDAAVLAAQKAGGDPAAVAQIAQIRAILSAPAVSAPVSANVVTSSQAAASATTTAKPKKTASTFARLLTAKPGGAK